MPKLGIHFDEDEFIEEQIERSLEDVQTEKNQGPCFGALEIVYGERQRDYGHPYKNFRQHAMMIEAILMEKLRPGEHITVLDVGLIMTVLKISRLTERYTFDSIKDIAGYAEATWRAIEKEREVNEKES